MTLCGQLLKILDRLKVVRSSRNHYHNNLGMFLVFISSPSYLMPHIMFLSCSCLFLSFSCLSIRCSCSFDPSGSGKAFQRLRQDSWYISHLVCIFPPRVYFPTSYIPSTTYTSISHLLYIFHLSSLIHLPPFLFIRPIFRSPRSKYQECS